ncbi:MAG: glycosyltransferase family 2 protein [Streptomycetaceae bacterium]|jgi:glycosyltransferase involved in cell wall biosynthesis|nr:glycosyltransferase family 2 protein [Streptomycetaceae bacterium]
MRLSIVVPCFNEADVLSKFHETIRSELAAVPAEIEICYVDDGSSDRTLEILRELAERDSAARYVSFSRNFGKEAAMLAGLEKATGDAVVIMDADLQHPPELVPRMLDLYHQGHDQVIARRTREGDKWARSAVSRAYYKLINKWVDVELVDGVGDFRLLSRKAVDALISLREYNRFSKGLYSWIGFEAAVFEYRNVTRELGETKWSFSKLLNYGMDGLISFNNRPLRLAIYFGLALSALAFLYACVIVGIAIVHGIDTPGYVTLIIAVTGLGGLQMTMLGLIGEYIGRIYYESKGRPHYLVRESEHAVETRGAVVIRETDKSRDRGPVAGASRAIGL